MLSTKKLTGSRSDAGQDAIRNFAADRFLLDIVVPKSFSLDPLELLPLEILLWVWLPSRCVLFNNGIFKVISFDTYSFRSLSLRFLYVKGLMISWRIFSSRMDPCFETGWKCLDWSGSMISLSLSLREYSYFTVTEGIIGLSYAVCGKLRLRRLPAPLCGWF